MITADVIDALVASGATVEMLAAAVKAMLPKRSSGAERQARYIAKLKASRASVNVSTDVSDASVTASQARTCSNTLEVKNSNIPPQNTTCSSTPRGQKPKTASRIRDDWKPNDLERQFARNQGLSEIEVDVETDKFVDWHKAASGQKSRKSDWTAAWRTWIRNSIEFKSSKSNQRSGRAEPRSMTTIALEMMRDIRAQSSQDRPDHPNADFFDAERQTQHALKPLPPFARSY